MERGEVREHLASTLEGYLQSKDEAYLARAYELGRQAMAANVGVLEMARIEHQALARILADLSASERVLRVYGDAGTLLAEGLAPFEMTHRGFQEANVALRRLNEMLGAEAERIAHMLHRETSQIIAAAQLVMFNLEREAGPSAQKSVEKLRGFLNELEAQVRQLAHELWPTILDDLGLVPALEFLVEGVAKRTGLAISVEGQSDDRFPQAVERTLYRIVQEALNNVAKHAKASRAIVGVHQENGSIRCSIKDDGVGLDIEAITGKKRERGLGLTGIRERLAQLGGTFQVHSVPGRETEIVVSIPLRR